MGSVRFIGNSHYSSITSVQSSQFWIAFCLDDRGVHKECLAACVDQKHSFLLSQSTFPNLQSFHRREEFCIVLEKLKTRYVCMKDSALNWRNNLILTFSCASPRRKGLEKSQPNLCTVVDYVIAENVTCSQIQENTTSFDESLRLQLNMEIANYARKNM